MPRWRHYDDEFDDDDESPHPPPRRGMGYRRHDRVIDEEPEDDDTEPDAPPPRPIDDEKISPASLEPQIRASPSRIAKREDTPEAFQTPTSSAPRSSFGGVAVSKRAVSKVEPMPSSHPFDAPGFKEGLRSAGYLEMFDTSRKRIKSRFTHALNKEQFKLHLDLFLKAKGVRKRGEFMIRFVGQQDVHSPFVHLYTTSLPGDQESLRIQPDPSEPDSPSLSTMWTFLRVEKGASHWSCRARKFWAVRVVFDGPEGQNAVPMLDKPPPRDDDDDRPVSVREETAIVRDAVPDTPTAVVVANKSLTSPISPNRKTIVESMRQLGISVAQSLPPSVQESMEKLPQSLSTRFDAIKESFVTWSQPRLEEAEDELEEAERRERRRARRARREARKAAEALEQDAQEELARAQDRKAERRERRRRESMAAEY